jgi:hypothetical protein
MMKVEERMTQMMNVEETKWGVQTASQAEIIVILTIIINSPMG